MYYKINKKVMEKVKENNQKCLCNLEKNCPCNPFIKNDICECGLYIIVNSKE